MLLSKSSALYTFIGLILFLIGGCSSSKNEFSGQVVPLSDSMFRHKVFNYTSEAEFKYLGDLPCLVDFSAEWCSPCKQMAPQLAEMAKKYEGKLIVYKVDVDKERLLAQNIGIGLLPTIIFFPKTGKPQISKGYFPKDILEKYINVIIKN